MPRINHKHKLFVDHYLSNGLNATRAYMAVYPDKTEESAAVLAHKLLRNVKVNELIEQYKVKESERLLVTKEQVIQDLLFIKDAQLQNNPQHSIKALEVINKMLGYYTENKVDITSGGNSINIQINLDDDKDD